MEKAELSITKEPSVTYKIRNLPEGGWADITIREWDGGGSFQCQSDFGEFAHIWTSIGNRNLRQFLIGLDKNYFCKKTRTDYLQFSAKKTCCAIREDILHDRKEGSLSPEDARVAWKELSSIEDDADTLEDCVELLQDGYYCHDAVADLIYEGDMLAVPFRNEYNPMCDLFWERVWPRITKFWQEELDNA